MTFSIIKSFSVAVTLFGSATVTLLLKTGAYFFATSRTVTLRSLVIVTAGLVLLIRAASFFPVTANVTSMSPKGCVIATVPVYLALRYPVDDVPPVSKNPPTGKTP